MDLTTGVRLMHASFCAAMIGTLPVSEAFPAAELPRPPIEADSSETWIDELINLLCRFRARYGSPCPSAGDSSLAAHYAALDAAYALTGPGDPGPNAVLVDALDALDLVNQNYAEIDAPTNADLDSLLTLIYLEEGGDPMFLP